jgi:adenylate kinase
MSALRLVFLGAPGSGKGTQSQLLEERYGAVQISTGDILRRHRAEKTELGNQAQQYIDRGELVPDDVIIGVMDAELPREGSFILDGFPRTVPQAEALDVLLKRLGMSLSGVILFEVPREELITRLTGRWTNPRSGRVYHEVFNPPKMHAVDDEDGGPLVQRADDTPETVERRLHVYESETKPLVDFYSSRNQLIRIDATKPVADVTTAVIGALENNGSLAANGALA